MIKSKHTKLFRGFNRLLLSVSLFLLISCTPDVETALPTRGELPVEGLAVVGDAYAAGFSAGVLSNDFQTKGPASGMSEAFLNFNAFPFATAALPDGFAFGFETETFYGPYLLEEWVDCLGDSIVFPRRMKYEQRPAAFDDNLSAPPFQNFAIPGLLHIDLNIPITFGANFDRPFVQRLAADTIISVKDNIIQSAPSFLFLWMGTEMIFEMIMRDELSQLPSAGSFAAEIETFLTEVDTVLQAGLIASIPDILDFPFFQLVRWDDLDLNAEQATLINDVYGDESYTYVKGRNPFSVKDEQNEFRRAVESDLFFYSIPIEEVKCNLLGSLFPFERKYYLDQDRIDFIRDKIQAYNQELARIAAEWNFAFADLHQFFNQINTGYIEKGVEFSFDFITGQFFSLDARYPTPRGYALVINELKRTMNQKYGSRLPGVNFTEREAVIFP